MVEHEKQINNSQLYDDIWDKWLDMKLYGPSSRWLRFLINKILKRIESKSIKHILDIGCGEGSNTFLFSRHFLNADVKGIDFSKVAINNAQKRYKTSNLSFCHDINSTLLNDQYDMITCFEVLEHVDIWKDLLQRMAVSSKKYLILSFPTGKIKKLEAIKTSISNILDCDNLFRIVLHRKILIPSSTNQPLRCLKEEVST